MSEGSLNSMPEEISDRTFSAINEQLEARSGRISHDFAQYVTDLQTAEARATTPARQELLKEHKLDLAALAHEVVTAAKAAGITDDEILNGPAENDA